MEKVCIPTGEILEDTRLVETVADTTGKTEPGKRLTGEKILQRRKYIVIPVLMLILLVALCLIFAPSRDSGDTMEGGSRLNVSMPDPTVVQLEESKRGTYEKQQAQQKRDRWTLSLSDFTGRLLEDKGQADGVSTPNGNIRQSADTYENTTKQLGGFYGTPQERVGSLEEKVDELSLRLEEVEAKNLRTESCERMMGQSYRMAARHPDTQPEVTPWEATEGEKPEPVLINRVETGTTSALEQPVADPAFVASLAVERDYGFNTMVGNGYRMSINTIPACIFESQALEQGGRVKLCLLEPLWAGSATVPADSLVTGTTDIRGEQLDVLVSNIECAGSIVPVQLTTCNVDEQRGIFVPGSESQTVVKEVTGDVGRSMGDSTSFAGSAEQQVAMDLVRGALQSGTWFISQWVKAVRIRLRAGYRVLLITKKQ